MKYVLYVDNDDVVEHAKHFVDDLRIEHLFTEAMHKAFEADMVSYTTPDGFTRDGGGEKLKERTCVCGYVHETGFDEDGKDWNPFLRSDIEFHEIDGTFILNGRDWETTKVRLIVCPKCNTVKIENKY